MVNTIRKIVTATSKASLLRALRANSIKFSKVKVLKKSTKTGVGRFQITFKRKRK